MSRYEGRLLQLQAALENPDTKDRYMIIGELAAMKEAFGLKPHEVLSSEY